MNSSDTHPITCKSCGTVFFGNYCNQCGEKVIKNADRSFKKFLNNLLIAITFADSKMIKTLWLVLKKPGFVSKEFAEGRRVNYLNPTSLFFVLNLIYFFFPLIQLFNASLNTQLLSPFRGFYQSIIAHKIVSMGMELSSFNLVYNLKTTGFAKMMVMVFVFIGSLPLNLLYRKRNRFFTDHVGYLVELACFNLFVNAIVLSILATFFGLGRFLNEEILTTIFISTNLYFLLRSGSIFYAERGWQLFLKAGLMILFLKVALEVYRAILFFVTVWSL
ncbi:MAG: DUF3667 domain-containing protein [Cyclobacteriaceae bacterium]|nr:DUF3667 domain-containing protein [Cyclobacteriaceae bacterium]